MDSSISFSSFINLKDETTNYPTGDSQKWQVIPTLSHHQLLQCLYHQGVMQGSHIALTAAIISEENSQAQIVFIQLQPASYNHMCSATPETLFYVHFRSSQGTSV
eukprot:9778228-Ditylum_brightwellii.AAC.1